MKSISVDTGLLTLTGYAPRDENASVILCGDHGGGNRPEYVRDRSRLSGATTLFRATVRARTMIWSPNRAVSVVPFLVARASRRYRTWKLRFDRFEEGRDRPIIRDLTVAGFEGVSIDHSIDERLGAVAGKEWRWRKVDVDRDIDLHGAQLAVAFDKENGRICGYVTMQSDPETESVGFTIWWWVHEARGQGLGRRLLEHALTHFQNAGMTVAKIETLEQNAIGQHLYPSVGFIEVARQIHYAMPLKDRPSDEHAADSV